MSRKQEKSQQRRHYHSAEGQRSNRNKLHPAKAKFGRFVVKDGVFEKNGSEKFIVKDGVYIKI